MTWSRQFGFGSGFMFMTPSAPAVDLTPVRIGVMQNVSMEISFDEKPLYGQNQFPAAVARGKAKATCKCEFAQIDSRAIGAVFLGTTPAAGEGLVVDLEAKAGTGTTFTASHTSGFEDLGLYYATTGQPLTQVNSGSEAMGSYSVSQSGTSSGKYSIASADSAASLVYSYGYNDSAGFKSSLTNQPMGTFIPFQTDLFQNNPELVGPSGAQWGARLYKCMSSKLSLASKQDDWIIPSMDFSIYANGAGQVLDFNTAI